MTGAGKKLTHAGQIILYGSPPNPSVVNQPWEQLTRAGFWLCLATGLLLPVVGRLLQLAAKIDALEFVMANLAGLASVLWLPFLYLAFAIGVIVVPLSLPLHTPSGELPVTEELP